MNIVIALVGFWITTVLPVKQMGTGTCTSPNGPPVVGSLFVHVRVGASYPVSFGQDIGFRQPGDTLNEVIEAPLGVQRYFVECSYDSGRTYGCAYEDSALSGTVSVPGDLDGNGSVNVADLSLWARYQQTQPRVWRKLP